jgi:hypothetical protein
LEITMSGSFSGKLRSGDLTLALALLALVACSGHVGARTWRVARDGSGDFTAIQPAVDAASPGDTIRIGPGLYKETTLFPPDGSRDFWPKPTHLAVTVDDLTIVGAGPTRTILGPEVPDTSPDGPAGVMTGSSISTLLIRGLTVDGGYFGMHLAADVEVIDCEIRNCAYGIVHQDRYHLVVTGCYSHGMSCGIATGFHSDATIAKCWFRDMDKGISSSGASLVRVQDSEFGDVGIAMQFIHIHAVVQSCHVDRSHWGAVVLDCGASVNLSNNVLDASDGYYSLAATGPSQVEGSGNVFSGGTEATLFFSKTAVGLQGNRIQRGDGELVHLEYYTQTPPRTLDMRYSDWGTTDGAEIAAWIWDGHDDPEIQAIVLYEPFVGQPQGTVRQSWGEVKASYR